MKIKITQDEKILRNGQYVGFIEDDAVYVFVRGTSLKIGTFDHRAEVVGMVKEYYDRSNR